MSWLAAARGNTGCNMGDCQDIDNVLERFKNPDHDKCAPTHVRSGSFGFSLCIFEVLSRVPVFSEAWLCRSMRMFLFVRENKHNLEKLS